MNDTSAERLLSALATASNELTDVLEDIDTDTDTGHMDYREAIAVDVALDKALGVVQAWLDRRGAEGMDYSGTEDNS